MELQRVLLEQDPRIVKRPAAGGDPAYVPISLRVLMPGERLTFSLFLKVVRRPQGDTAYSLCLMEGEELRPEWFKKLHDWGLQEAYFHENDLGKAIAYLNNHLLLQDRETLMAPKEMLILREHLVLSLRLACKAPRLAPAVNAAKESIQQLVQAVMREALPWKLIWDMLYRDYSLYNHSVNVAVLGVSWLAFQGRPPADCLVLGLAGLFHDVGLTQISEEVLEKREALTPEEWEGFQKHPCLGYRLLKGNPELPMASLRLILEHHELADGTGYPQGLPLKRQHPLTRLISILEFYDGLTIRRPCYPCQSSYEALKALQKQRGNQGPAFDPKSLKSFIEFLALS